MMPHPRRRRTREWGGKWQIAVSFRVWQVLARPVDVWIERILRVYYLDDTAGPMSYEYMRQFAEDYFGAYAGYAQE